MLQLLARYLASNSGTEFEGAANGVLVCGSPSLNGGLGSDDGREGCLHTTLPSLVYEGGAPPRAGDLYPGHRGKRLAQWLKARKQRPSSSLVGLSPYDRSHLNLPFSIAGARLGGSRLRNGNYGGYKKNAPLGAQLIAQGGAGAIQKGAVPRRRFRLTFRAGWLTPDSLVGLGRTSRRVQVAPAHVRKL